MMLIRNFLIGLWLLSSVCSAATDVVWIRFQVNHAYNDLETSCTSVRTGSSLYFTAEMENGEITRAAVHDVQGRRNKTIWFSSEALKQIKLFKDGSNRYWLKELPLDALQVKWILYFAPRGTFPQLCLLPQTLQTISPTSFVLEFDTKEIEEFLFTSSRRASFTGLRQDGQSYDAKLQLVQREFKFEK